MLRQQSPVFGPMDFLAGDGEMASLIRNTDWSEHSFGPSEEWPQSLRSALAICLNSAFPTAIYWGSELRLLYNDAWAPIPGPRHPTALGAPAKEVWSDIWSIIEPQFSEVIRSGKGLFLQDHMLPMQRYGFEEETYWSYSFTPLRGEQGNIVGVWNTGSETTDNVIQRRNAEFLLKLNEALRSAGSAQEGLRIAVERLGVHLSAAGVRLAIPGKPGAGFDVAQSWAAPQARLPDASSPPWISAAAEAELRHGKTLFLTRRDPELDPQCRAYLEARRISNAIFVPWITGGRLEQALLLHWTRPRAYSALDVSLVERVLDIVMGWVSREKTLAREAVMAQEIDHRARNMLAILRSTARLIRADTVAEFREKLDERITSLSRTHGLLSRKKWGGRAAARGGRRGVLSLRRRHPRPGHPRRPLRAARSKRRADDRHARPRADHQCDETRRAAHNRRHATAALGSRDRGGPVAALGRELPGGERPRDGLAGWRLRHAAADAHRAGPFRRADRADDRPGPPALRDHPAPRCLVGAGRRAAAGER
ncbi:PAS domain-containing protein [Yangia mangrovi]|uniref:histidine kinase n=1 Tax=Alloyangia mangrovi TaxID=1779329 RepID=A0ABT2KPQ2_9RHOB|nr:HWE histidine kinase domain-containing protein [Alloyangia mangrovi]MCT4371352.1 PAS domain-containing protein [Alloyangia mangrovi]